MTKIEEAARAVLAEVPEGYGMTEAEAGSYARAVLAAIREPDEAMMEAAPDWSGRAMRQWRAMIDALLSPPGEGEGREGR